MHSHWGSTAPLAMTRGSMRTQRVRDILWAAVIALAPLSGAAAPLAMQAQVGLAWVCGGVGAGERRALAAIENQANLKLLFVTQKRGGYLADVRLAVFDAQGKRPRLRVSADGPVCLLRLAPGVYRLEASFRGTTHVQRVRIAEESGHLTRSVFAFAGEPWDGIWASEEEKRQASEP